MIAETHWPLALGLMLIAGFGSWVFTATAAISCAGQLSLSR